MQPIALSPLGESLSHMAEIEASRELSRADVAAYLREFADQLDAREAQHAPTGRSVDDTTNGHGTIPSRDTSNRSDTETHGTTTSPPDAAGPESDTGTDADETDANHGATYEKVTFFVGNDSATINPPETMTLDIAVDSDSAMLSSANRRSVDFHLEWDTDGVDDDGDLHIE